MALEKAIERALKGIIIGVVVATFPGWLAYQEGRHLIMHAKGVEHHYCEDGGEYIECTKQECYCSFN